MRRFKEYNKNKRFIKTVINIAKKYGAKGFKTLNGYFVYVFGKNSVLHFNLPNNYKVGVWLDRKTIFAEHLEYIDKFKPSAVEFARGFNSLYDIEKFIKEISNIRNKEYDEEYENSNKERIRINMEGYQYLRSMEGVKDIEIICNPYSISEYKYIIHSNYTTVEEVEDKIISKFEDTKYTKKYGCIFRSFGRYYSTFMVLNKHIEE